MGAPDSTFLRQVRAPGATLNQVGAPDATLNQVRQPNAIFYPPQVYPLIG
ncbi:MAG: hypothetical protein GF315_13120 [candidate division Zixibacteria bacterium]|nr:hypothetical protein [candidate division Zixibacteria bacterium]